jgi:hypothetical protein
VLHDYASLGHQWAGRALGADGVGSRRTSMTDLNENTIRERAQWLWHQAGSPEGQDLEFWLQAEREVATEGGDLGSSDDEPRHDNFQ